MKANIVNRIKKRNSIKNYVLTAHIEVEASTFASLCQSINPSYENTLIVFASTLTLSNAAVIISEFHYQDNNADNNEFVEFYVSQDIVITDI